MQRVLRMGKHDDEVRFTIEKCRGSDKVNNLQGK